MDVVHARTLIDPAYVAQTQAVARTAMIAGAGAASVNFIHEPGATCCQTESPADLKLRWSRGLGELILIDVPDNATAAERMTITREVWEGKRPYQDFAGHTKWADRP